MGPARHGSSVRSLLTILEGAPQTAVRGDVADQSAGNVPRELLHRGPIERCGERFARAKASWRENSRDVLGNRVRGDEPHLGREAALASKLRLLDRSRRSERRLDGEGFPAVDVVAHEALALLRNGATHVARDRSVAPEDLRAAIVDIERIDAERRHGEVPRLSRAPRAKTRGSPSKARRLTARPHAPVAKLHCSS